MQSEVKLSVRELLPFAFISMPLAMGGLPLALYLTPYYASELGISAAETAYVGDDVVDLPVMRRVGLAIAVQDAHPLVRTHSHWQTPTGGGRGAARDVCEMLMEAKGVLEQEMSSYL